MASEKIEMDILDNEQEIDSDSSRSRSSDESNSDSDAEEETARDIQDYYAVHDIPRCSTFAGMAIVEFFDRDKIKVGQRVVRGVDWDKGDEDGGEGNVGTVVKIFDDSQQVRVQWDSQATLDAQKNGDIFNYRIGMDMKYDLRLFDNAQTGAHHKFFACDGCDEAPIRGMRWRCLYCDDYDLCTECYMNDFHNLDHAFERYQGMKTMSVNVGTRVDSQDWEASGIFSENAVKSREDPTVTGTVEDLDDNIATLYNCDAKVTWEGDIKKRHRVGREGKVDIRFTEPAKVKYFQDHLQEISKVNAVIGIRVVERSDKDHVTVGTITSVKEIETEQKELKRRRRRSTQRKSAPLLKERGSVNLHQNKQTEENSVQHCSLTVQWDDGETDENVETSKREILLFDNSQIGTKQCAMCDGCATGSRIKGIRWKCDECSDYDLCTSCYMSAKDGHIGHKFQRITEPAERKKLETSRTNPEVKVKTALGIFKGATVQELESNTEIKGTVAETCHYRVNNARCIVVVNKDDDEDQQIRGQFTDFQSDNDNEGSFYYPSHLPDLGKDIQGYVKVEDEDSNAKIFVELWYQKDVPTSSSDVKYSLYLIFAHKPEDDENKFRPLEDVRKFARKSRLPCQLALEKVLFLEEAVVIHKDTTNETIQKLVKDGVKKFVRGEMEEEEDEQKYFQRMSVYVSGRVPLPVFISLRNGVIHTDVLENASKNKIPVVSFQKKSRDVYVLTMKDDFFCVKAMEHKIDLKAPWKVTNMCIKDYDTGCYFKDDIDDEITRLDDIPELENVAALISYLLIGVYMNKSSDRENDIFGENSHVYPNALSMYLLRTGKWKIPKQFIKKSFNHRSIEFIFEEKMTEDFKNGLWKELELKTKSAYVIPTWKEKGTDVEEEDEEEDEVDAKSGGRLHVKISDLFGLIFFALLKKKYYDGAKQLIETGCVRITHLLIGCTILQEAADDWNTNQLQKEKVLQMKAMCTQQALRITSCIHEADTKDSRKNNSKDVTILGQRIDHAGRLLLNHDYLSDAIKTENSTYLNDEIVKKVINQMWYKHESVSFRRGMLFFTLTMFHGLLLLPLMITMENKPLQWLYRQYNVPVMKVLLNAFGWLMILVALAYMLLFDFTERISRTDWFIIAWMASFFLDETKQIGISIRRGKIGAYLRDWWNRLDWLTMTVYLSGMLTKLGSGQAYHNASKILLVLTFILMCVRFLNSLTISEIIGAKLVMIRKMFVDTFAFLAIMTVIILCYSVSYYAILYSENSDLSFTQIERVFRNGFWILFGELSLESDRLKEPDCTFNRTIYNAGEVDRCPSELGLFLAPYLKSVYALLAIVLLLNLLIAMYSHTFSEVHDKSKFYWALLQTDFLEEYSVKSIFPIHFQLLVVPVCLVHFLFWVPFSCLRSKFDFDEYDDLNADPMFVRVFLYDANFDLKLDATREAEGKAALKASGDLGGTDKDKLTVLQKKIKNHKRVTNNIDERTSKMQKDIVQIKKDIRLLCKAVSPDTMMEEEDDNLSTDILDIDHIRLPSMRMSRLMWDDIEETSSEDSDDNDSD